MDATTITTSMARSISTPPICVQIEAINDNNDDDDDGEDMKEDT